LVEPAIKHICEMKSGDVQYALKEIEKNKEQIAQDRAYYQPLIKRGIDWYCDYFNVDRFWPYPVRFGGGSLEKECFDWIRKNIPDGSSILEFGSGLLTREFAKYYKMYSVENNIEYLNKYNSTYIYAPMKDNWYDVERLKRGLPKRYDLIIVDGPVNVGQKQRRHGFLKNIDLFKTDIPILFDDLCRKDEHDLLLATAQHLGKDYEIFNTRKKFGIVYGNKPANSTKPPTV
jgi:hypothetical protein